MEIITQTAPGLQTTFEQDYIYNFLLAGAGEIKSDGKIVVYSSDRREKRPSDVKHGDVIIHLSNEHLKYDYSFLDRSNTVLRSYYHPFLWKKRCYAIPLGWQTGFGNQDGNVGEHNQYIWCFIGQMKGYRKPMYEAFKDINSGYASFAMKWNSGKLSEEEVKQIYLNSAFALVPFGDVHADTMRIMEVLEWGCIPVVVEFLRSDYYRYIYGDHPFVLAKNWEDARRKVLALWDDKDALAKRQKAVAEWYHRFKMNLQADVTDILSGREPSRGEQWRYQKSGRLNLKMLQIWYYHFYYKKRPCY